MKDFYEILTDYKKANKLNNKQIGEVIGMTQDQFRMSVTRKNLSKLEIEKIEQVFFNSDKLEQTKEDELLVMQINRLFDSETFQNKLENFIKEKLPTINSEELVNLESHIINFLNKETKKNKKV